MLTFRVAVGIALALALVTALAGQFTAGRLALLLLYLVLASLVPVVMVPLGIALLLVEVLNNGGPITAWLSSVASGTPRTTSPQAVRGNLVTP